MNLTPSPKRKAEVQIAGQHFQVRTDKSDEYLKKLSAFIHDRYEEIQRHHKASSMHHVALLLSLNLADQLFAKEEELKTLKDSLETRTQEALREVQNALSLLPEIMPEPMPTDVSDDELQ